MEHTNDVLSVNPGASYKDFIKNVVNGIILNVVNNVDGAGSNELIQRVETLIIEEKSILRSFLLREDLVLARLSLERLQEVMAVYEELYELAATFEPNAGGDKNLSLTGLGLGKSSVELAAIPKLDQFSGDPKSGF